jgi:hypothetical protein
VHASKAEDGDARVEEDDRGLETVVEGDQEVVHNHKVAGVVLADDDDGDDEVVVVADNRIQDVAEVVVDHTYVAGVVEVAQKDPGEAVGADADADVDVYGRTLFFFLTLSCKER